MPSPVEAFPCGSRSMTKTVSPTAASAVPRLMAVVVLPTPPFSLATAMTRGRMSLLNTDSLFHHQDRSSRISLTGMAINAESPGFGRLGQFCIEILALVEIPSSPGLEKRLCETVETRERGEGACCHGIDPKLFGEVKR